MNEKGDKRQRSTNMKIDAAAVLRVAGALLMSAVAVAIVLSSIFGSLRMAPIVLMVALVHLVPAAILFCLLAWLGRINLFSCIASGALFAAVPIGIWTFPLSFSDSSFNAWSGGRQTVIDGVPTLAGWLDYGQFLLLFIGIGAVAGVFFWFLIKHRFSANSPDTFQSDRKSKGQSFSSWWMPIISMLMIAGVFLSPALTKDRSCHNLFRDGRTSASPSLTGELIITKDEWRDLERFYGQFAQAHDLNFKGDLDDSDEVVSTLSLSMCSEPGLVIKSNKQHWAHLGGGPVPGRGVSVAVFSLNEEIDWIPISRRLFSALDHRWPGQIKFRDGNGRVISIDETPISDPLDSHSRTSAPWLEPRWWIQ